MKRTGRHPILPRKKNFKKKIEGGDSGYVFPHLFIVNDILCSAQCIFAFFHYLLFVFTHARSFCVHAFLTLGFGGVGEGKQNSLLFARFVPLFWGWFCVVMQKTWGTIFLPFFSETKKLQKKKNAPLFYLEKTTTLPHSARG